MQTYIVIGLVAILAIASVAYNVLASRVRRLAREHQELIALIFHHIRDLLTSIRWHAELLKEPPFEVQGSTLQMVNRLEEGIDRALALHRKYLITSEGTTEQKKTDSRESTLTIRNRADIGNVAYALHDIIDLLTAIKWQTELLAAQSHKNADAASTLFRRIDESVDDAIALIDRFLRIGARQKKLSLRTAEKILDSNVGRFLSSEQKEALRLPNDGHEWINTDKY